MNALRRHLISLFVIVLTGLAAFPAWAVGSVTLQPSSGEPDATFTVILTGWKPDERIRRIRWDGSDLATDLQTSGSGDLTVSFQVPSGASGGAHVVSVQGQGPAATATFTVIVPAATTTTTTTNTTTPTTATTTPKTTTTTATTTGPGPVTTTQPASTTIGSGAVSPAETSTTIGSGGAPPMTGTGSGQDPDDAGDGGGWPKTLAIYLGMTLAAAGALWFIRTHGGPLLAQTGLDTPQPPQPAPINPMIGDQEFWTASDLVIERGARVEFVQLHQDHYLAAGLTTGAEGVVARVWDSLDGIEWLPVGEMEAGLVTSVSVGDRVHAFGAIEGPDSHPLRAAWRLRTDGTWDRLTAVDGDNLDHTTFEQGLVVGDSFAAIAREKTGTRLYTSTDGATWNAWPGPVAVERLFPVAGRILGFGRHTDKRIVEVVDSDDGTTWRTWEGAHNLPFEMAHVDIITDIAGGYIAGGFDRMNHTGLLWVSDDSLEWHRVPVDFGPASEVVSVQVMADIAYLVLSRTRSGHPPRIEMWKSTDVVEWTPIENAVIDHALPIGVTCQEDRISIYAQSMNDARALVRFESISLKTPVMAEHR